MTTNMHQPSQTWFSPNFLLEIFILNDLMFISCLADMMEIKH